MAKQSKRMADIRKLVEAEKVYALDEALNLIKDIAKKFKVKFLESVEVCLKLGIDTRKSDQVVRGATVLPKGTGKTVRVAVFAQADKATDAENAGADRVGFEDLAEEIKKGELNYDVIIATPDAMRVVGALGPVLGPRGLMPNPKVGTVTMDVATAVKNAKSGQARFRADKGGNVHAAVGLVNFESADLAENISALVQEVNKLKPTTSKGIYLQKMVISSTMGPGLVVDVASVEKR